MTALKFRPWVPAQAENLVQTIAAKTAGRENDEIANQIEKLTQQNRIIHEQECFNLNPATNVMNPKAEALLSAGLGSRPSLGYPGDKYETGLEAIEEIEVIAAELCAQVFNSKYAEIRVPSGALANLYAFMAICKPGDTIIAPPASIGGHVTHHDGGCAGLYGLKTAPAPVNADGYSVDVDDLRRLAHEIKPALITIGGSLNLFPHPVAELRAIADEVDAKLLFDAAHQCGIIAGGAWPNPLNEGAHLMTMSTYKSLAGPAGGLIVTNEADLAEQLDTIAFPGMTANFDAAKSAALAITMLDWKEHGAAYSRDMVETAAVFAETLSAKDIPVFARSNGFTKSHQFAIEAVQLGGGQRAAKRIRKAGFLSCGIGLPIPAINEDMNGLRIGTPELVRWGMRTSDIPELARLLSESLTTECPDKIAPDVQAYRQQFQTIKYVL